MVSRSDSEYDIYVSSDTNAPQRCQWFYFMAENTRKDATVRFTVLNQSKHPHFYAEGMRPTVFSELDNATKYTGWNGEVEDCTVSKVLAGTRACGARLIAIDPDQETEPAEQTQEYYYTISFTHTFAHDNDRVYFSFCKPYSYTSLRQLYDRLERTLFVEAVDAKCDNVNMRPEVEIETRDVYYKRVQIATSVGGVPVDAITISANTPAFTPRGYVVITARVHAAETPGSYKVQGILRFLLGKDPVAAALRQECVFLVVPMLNPDGVILGNSRYSMEGLDLNRCWGNPSCYRHPAIYALKELLRKLVDSGNTILVYCDLHGHSKLYNSFIYACHKVANATFTSWTRTRLLPRILAKKCPLFDYRQCSFKVEIDKVNTARVVIWKEFGVTSSFTLESSIYAYTVGNEVVRFAEREYEQIGESLMQALHEYQQILRQLNARHKGPEGDHPDEEEAKRRERRELRLQSQAQNQGEKPGSRATSCLAKYRTYEIGSATGGKASPSKPAGTRRVPVPETDSPCKSHFDRRISHHGRLEPSLAEYFTPTELEVLINTMSGTAPKEELTQSHDRMLSDTRPQLQGLPAGDDEELRQIQLIQAQRKLQSLGRRKPRSVAGAELFVRLAQREPEVERVQVPWVPLQPKVMKMAVTQNMRPNNAAMFREPVALSKRYMLEARASYHKRQMNGISPQQEAREWRNYGRTKKVLTIAARVAELRHAGTEKMPNSPERGALFNPTTKFLNRSQNAECRGPINGPPRSSGKSKRKFSQSAGKEIEDVSLADRCARLYGTTHFVRGKADSSSHADRSFGHMTYYGSRAQASEPEPGNCIIRSPDESGFRNFARTLDKRRTNERGKGMLCSQEVARIVLCRSKRFGDLDPKYYPTELPMFAAMKEGTPQGLCATSLFSATRSKSKG